MSEKMRDAAVLLDLENETTRLQRRIGGNGLARTVARRGLSTHATEAFTAFRLAGMPVLHIRSGFRPDHADTLGITPRLGKPKESGVAVPGQCEVTPPSEFLGQESKA
jgi:nicotinamidase-related amidase